MAFNISSATLSSHVRQWPGPRGLDVLVLGEREGDGVVWGKVGVESSVSMPPLAERPMNHGPTHHANLPEKAE